MTNVVVILTTMSDAAQTDELARALVDERLAACVNVGAPITSIYRWQNAVEREGERQLLIKTTRDRVRDVERRLRELHPYELPEFLVLPVESGSEAYLRWVSECVAADTR
ncbi:MAG TPA: divalent-cation tolerance protein CutA [Vicinamibacterales bacterium]|nr:divalent-cation tolerance protein CutA [Vicinamibacterales bacterium]